MKEGWNVVLRYDESFATLNLWIVKQNGDGSREIVEPLDLTIRRDYVLGETTPEPTIRFDERHSKEFLQGLAEGLVNAGFRPDELKASDKQLEAVSYHLEDMRRIVFPPTLVEGVPRKT